MIVFSNLSNKELAHPQSLSRIEVIVELHGKASFRAVFLRHLAPSTVRSLLKVIPLSGRVSRFQDSFVYISTGLMLGVEKGKTEFKRGEIAFYPANGGLCFFLKKITLSSPMNPIGWLLSDPKPLEGVRPGDVLSVRLS